MQNNKENNNYYFVDSRRSRVQCRHLFLLLFIMKDSSCCKQTGLSAMFRPTFVSVVVGVVMMTAGAGKFIGGAEVMSYLGTAVLSVFLSETTVAGLGTLALILGYIAASIELI